MKVFGHPMSTCTRKVLTTFAEKKVTPEFVTVDILKGAGHTPEYLAKQPFGQVPVLEDGDLRVFESRAIIRYLDEVLPGVALAPKDAKGRALLDQWISVEASNFYPHAMSIIRELVLAPLSGAQGNQATVADAKAKLAKCVAVMETQLAKVPFITGDQFTLADIVFMPYVDYVTQTSVADVITSSPNVVAWWGRVSARPSWKTATGKA